MIRLVFDFSLYELAPPPKRRVFSTVVTPFLLLQIFTIILRDWSITKAWRKSRCYLTTYALKLLMHEVFYCTLLSVRTKVAETGLIFQHTEYWEPLFQCSSLTEWSPWILTWAFSHWVYSSQGKWGNPFQLTILKNVILFYM